MVVAARQSEELTETQERVLAAYFEPESVRHLAFSCILMLSSHTLVGMSDYQPHNQTPGNPFEFGITLLLCTAVSATLAVLIAGIAFLVYR